MVKQDFTNKPVSKIYEKNLTWENIFFFLSSNHCVILFCKQTDCLCGKAESYMYLVITLHLWHKVDVDSSKVNPLFQHCYGVGGGGAWKIE